MEEQEPDRLEKLIIETFKARLRELFREDPEMNRIYRNDAPPGADGFFFRNIIVSTASNYQPQKTMVQHQAGAARMRELVNADKLLSDALALLASRGIESFRIAGLLFAFNKELKPIAGETSATATSFRSIMENLMRSESK